MVWAGLLALTLVRLAVAASTPLSPDEAYYWVWSRALAPGYLDHPPMVALWIWAGTALAGDGALGVRLLAPLSAALGTVLLADAAGRLFPGRGAGLRAAVLLNATLMLGAGAVTMTPDTPLLFFWTAAAWALARVVAGGGGGWWLIAGVASGLAFDSKYTAALLGPGAALLLLVPGMHGWWRRPAPWAGAVLAVAITVPVLAWNAAHGWASLVKQGGRVGDWTPTWRFLAELVGGQAGLATPGVFAVFCAVSAVAARRWRDPAWALPAALVLPGALVFVQHALGDRVQANWVAVLYPGCALAAGGLGAPVVAAGGGTRVRADRDGVRAGESRAACRCRAGWTRRCGWPATRHSRRTWCGRRGSRGRGSWPARTTARRRCWPGSCPARCWARRRAGGCSRCRRPPPPHRGCCC